MTFASAIGCVSMSTNWHASRFASSSRRPQTYFFKGGHVFSYDPYLDHTCLDVGAVNTVLNIFLKELGNPFNRARRHRYMRNRWEKTLAGARDHVKSGFARDLFEKANVARRVIIGGQIDDGADACSSYKFEFFDCLSDKFCSATPGLRPFVQKVRPIGNMLVSESKAELRRIDRSEHSFNYTSVRDLGPVFAGVSFRSVSDP